ncbi:hypothetical protein [Pseudoxanthomonas mexicana]|uniref:hypothetical protein n=1 Tax=Pseudoxanthomonas mexicana TaxID=128785 RepID=UPI0024E1EAA7|nr:hypothetical protein [Pseudoxanthomonas mexicana]
MDLVDLAVGAMGERVALRVQALGANIGEHPSESLLNVIRDSVAQEALWFLQLRHGVELAASKQRMARAGRLGRAMRGRHTKAGQQVRDIIEKVSQAERQKYSARALSEKLRNDYGLKYSPSQVNRLRASINSAHAAAIRGDVIPRKGR